MDSIPCVSVSFPNASDSGRAGSDTDTPAAHLFEVRVTRMMDGSSVILHQMSTRGDWFDKATLEFDVPQEGKLMPVSVIDLTDGVVGGYQMSGQGTGPASETVSLMYTKMEFDYVPSPDPSSPLKPDTVGYDLAQERGK